MNLRERPTSAAFYDRRYADGYMDDWRADKRRRIFDLIAGLELPATGTALDFGCGTGVFTSILQQALPGWRVCGTDISQLALAKARARFPACTFFAPQDADAMGVVHVQAWRSANHGIMDDSYLAGFDETAVG